MKVCLLTQLYLKTKPIECLSKTISKACGLPGPGAGPGNGCDLEILSWADGSEDSPEGYSSLGGALGETEAQV